MLDITSLRMALDRVKVDLGPQLLQNSKYSLVVIQILKCYSLFSYQNNVVDYSNIGMLPESILSYLYSTDTLICETVLSQRQPSSTYQTLDSEQLRILCEGLLSAKSQIENYLSFRPEHYSGMDMALVMQFRHSVQMVYRLSLLDDPGWNRASVSNTVDVIDCLEQAAQRLEQASKITASTGNSAAHSVILKALTGLRASIPTQDAVLEQLGTLPRDMQVPGDPGAETQNAIPWSEMTFSMEDDTWLTEALSATYGWGG